MVRGRIVRFALSQAVDERRIVKWALAWLWHCVDIVFGILKQSVIAISVPAMLQSLRQSKHLY